MRTTINIDDDILDRARTTSAITKKPFRFVVNEALRNGLEIMKRPAARKKFRTRAKPGGLRPGFSIDNIGELLAQAEGEDWR